MAPMAHERVAGTNARISFAGAEAKVRAATTASGLAAAVTTLILWLIGHFVSDIPDGVTAAVLVLVTTGLTAASTFLSGWFAPHTQRPLAELDTVLPLPLPPLPGLGENS